MNEKYWKEGTGNMSSYNSQLLAERKSRMPFLDSQTGVAQNNCSLWISPYQRGPGLSHGQLYTYPARRWRKKKIVISQIDTSLTKESTVETGEDDLHQISAIENPIAKEEEPTNASFSADKSVNKDYWYEDVENISEPPDAGEIDDYSDMSDFEETYRKKKKKASNRGGRGRGKRVYNTTSRDKYSAEEESEKPYACEMCSARYKTRPGLTYHYNHFHNGQMEESSYTASPKPPVIEDEKSDDTKGPNDYCDFCLGDASLNKKTKQSEILVSCSDCGRSGHPTCLQFTENMIVSVKKYPWQCIECKSCLLCRTSENDDQLLFCDDCDRGYHMYCLKPPLAEPPEGNWSCHLCIEEFHGGKKPAYMQ